MAATSRFAMPPAAAVQQHWQQLPLSLPQRLLSRCLCLSPSLSLFLCVLPLAESCCVLKWKLQVFRLVQFRRHFAVAVCCRSPCCRRRRFCFTFVCLIAGFYNRIYHAASASACCLCLCLPHILTIDSREFHFHREGRSLVSGLPCQLLWPRPHHYLSRAPQ